MEPQNVYVIPQWASLREFRRPFYFGGEAAERTCPARDDPPSMGGAVHFDRPPLTFPYDYV
jgi:hypothetical protein